MAATKNAMLPVGTDYTPPNKWVTQSTGVEQPYVWPKFITASRASTSTPCGPSRPRAGAFSPQTREMSPIYTGKDVSFIDTKQMQRLAENTLMGAEKFATIAR